MIYTVTLNPSIDYIVHVDELKLGELNRMKMDLKLPGGKGINVSRILEQLKSPTTALGFLGGFTGRFISECLEKEGIKNAFTLIAQDTRINIKLKSQEETEINGLGPMITDEEIQQLKNTLKKVKTEDTVIFSGSTPPDFPQNFYTELIEIIKANGAEFVIDTTGPDLLRAIRHKPLLIKPNKEELAELFQTEFQEFKDMFPYGEKLRDQGAKYVLISMAGEGAFLFTKTGIYQADVLKGTVKNSVGAGDSMIAGFVSQYEKTKDALLAFSYGIACGSATAFSDDLATREKILELLPSVHITKL